MIYTTEIYQKYIEIHNATIRYKGQNVEIVFKPSNDGSTSGWMND